MQLTTPLEYDDLKHCDLPVDFTERVKNVSIRYLSAQQPKGVDLDNWLVLPLYKHGHDLPIDNDGKTALLLANVDVLSDLLEQWQQRISFEKENPTVNPSKMIKNSLEAKPRQQSRQSNVNSHRMNERPSDKNGPPAPKMAKMEPLDQPEQVVVPPEVTKAPFVSKEVKEKPVVLLVKESAPPVAEPKVVQKETTVTLSLILEQMKFSEKEKYQLRKLLEAEGAHEQMSVDSMRKAIQMAYSKFAPVATEKAPSNISTEDSITPTAPAVNIPNKNAANVGVKREWAAVKKKGTRNAPVIQKEPMVTPKTPGHLTSSSLANFIRKTPSKPITPVNYSRNTSADCTPKTPRIPVIYKMKTPIKYMVNTPVRYTPDMSAGDTPKTPKTPSYEAADTDLVLPVTPKKHKGFTTLPHRNERNKRSHSREDDQQKEFSSKRTVSSELSMLFNKSDSPHKRIQFTPPKQGSRVITPLKWSTPINCAPIQQSGPIRMNKFKNTKSENFMVSLAQIPLQSVSSDSMPDPTNRNNEPIDNRSEGSPFSSSLSTCSTFSEPSSSNLREDYEREVPSHSSQNYQQTPEGNSKNYQQM